MASSTTFFRALHAATRPAAVALGVCALGLAAAGHAAAAGASTDSVTIQLTAVMAPGSLVISVPDGEVLLPSPTVGSGGTRLVSVGRLQPITVTDNRAEDPGWTLSGEVLGTSPGAAGFDGADLGWTPGLVDESPGQLIVLGLTVKPGPATGSGLFGLDQPQVLAVANAGGGLGTVHVTATLSLALPTGTRAGRYSVTLTLTAV